MQFAILGPLQVHAGSQLLDLGRPKQRAVLAMLVLHANHVVSVDRMIDDLWSGEPPERAVGAVHAYVSMLRKSLEPNRQRRAPAEVLVSQAPGYVLNVPPGDVDALHFEALVGEADRHRRSEPVHAIRTLDLALGLWRGPLLAEFATEPWVAAAAVRFDELRGRAESLRFDLLLDTGHAEDLVVDVEAALSRHPLRERLWAQLMIALYRSGRQAEALQAFQRARQLFAEELGLHLSAELRDLEQQVLSQAPALDAPMMVESSAPPESSEPVTEASGTDGEVVVGREPELQRLADSITSARLGRGSTVLVTGAAGIGKTRLVEHATSGSDVRVVWARCVDGGTAPPLWPWYQIAAALGERGESLAEALRSPSAADSPIDQSARQDMYRAAVGALSSAAAIPLVVVIDDLQWADVASLHVTRLLLSSIAELPIVLILTLRDERDRGSEVLSIVDAVSRMSNGSRLPLLGLTATAIGEQLRARFGRRPTDAAVEWLHERTAGNAFFLTEIIRELADVDALEDLEAMQRLVPETVVDAVMRRIAQLPAMAADVLTVAAIVGREFDHRIVAELVGIDVDHCLDVIEVATISGLVDDGSTATRYRFRHDLVREAIYRNTPGPRRSRVHARAAIRLDHLHRGHRGHANELASHAWRGRGSLDALDVVRYLFRSATGNVEVGAFEQADEQLSNALALLDEVPEGDERERLTVEILVRLVRVRTNTKGYAAPETVAALERARRLHERHSAGADDGGLFAELAASASVAGELATAGDLGRQLITMGTTRADQSTEYLGRFRVAVTAYQRGQIADAIEEMRSAVDVAGRVDGETHTRVYGVHPLPSSAMWLAMMLRVSGEPDESRRFEAAARDACRTIGTAINTTWLSMMSIWLAVFDRDADLAWSRSQQYALAAGAAEVTIADPEAHLATAWALLRRGEPDEALTRVRRGAGEQASVGRHGLVLRGAVIESEILVAIGSTDAALDLIDRTLLTSGATGEALWLAELHRMRAGAYERQGRRDDAQASLRLAQRTAAAQGARLFAAWASEDLDRLDGT